MNPRLAVLAMLVGSTTSGAADPAPPRERDCTRWVEAAWPRRALEPELPASGAPPSVYADRLPNLEAVGRRLVTLELLLCEQLNLKDKLDYLIRRSGR